MAGVSSRIRRIYLSIYNWVIFFVWTKVLYYAIFELLHCGHETIYAAVEQPLLFAQTAAFMEVLHSIVGFVKSPMSAILPQLSARLFLTWGILWSFPEARSHVAVTFLILCWSITDIIRYSFFGLKEAFGVVPPWLLWLRYSSFLVFIPIGFVSELSLIYAAIPYMKASEKYCLPMKWNFRICYYHACILLTTLFIPGGPYMFRHMLGQRRKVLSKAKLI